MCLCVCVCVCVLVRALTCSNPDHVMDLHVEGSAETIRLNDDAFAKVCDLVNDIKVEVRTKACVLMGSFRNVQLDILLQTFSKRIMSRLKRRVTNKATGKKRVGPGTPYLKGIPFSFFLSFFAYTIIVTVDPYRGR